MRGSALTRWLADALTTMPTSTPFVTGSDVRCVVSISPVRLNRDSRTLKQAFSLARAGYRSVVVAAATPLEITPNLAVPRMPVVSLQAPSVVRRRFETMRTANLPWIAHAALFTGWFALYAARLVVRPLVRMPRADLYILHECSSYPAVKFHTRLTRTPFIYDAHDFYSRIEPANLQPLFDRRFVTPLMQSLERRAVQNAAAVMTVSDGLALEIEKAYARKPTVVRNAHDPRLDRSETLGLRKRLALGPDDFIIVTIGNAKRGQALEQGLEALAELPGHVHWACVGGGYERIASVAVSRNLGHRFHLVGVLEPDEIVPAIREANVALVLYHGYSENYLHSLPNGFFQALAAGLPQIIPPLPEIASLARQNGFAVEADPLEPNLISTAVLKLMTDARLRTDLARAARAAASTLCWQTEERRFLKLVGELLLSPYHGYHRVVPTKSNR
jgi:glycosyltransferase involved in cell wall biosynthesis